MKHWVLLTEIKLIYIGSKHAGNSVHNWKSRCIHYSKNLKDILRPRTTPGFSHCTPDWLWASWWQASLWSQHTATLSLAAHQFSAWQTRRLASPLAPSTRSAGSVRPTLYPDTGQADQAWPGESAFLVHQTREFTTLTISGFPTSWFSSWSYFQFPIFSGKIITAKSFKVYHMDWKRRSQEWRKLLTTFCQETTKIWHFYVEFSGAKLSMW